jgi:hypothetical protein
MPKVAAAILAQLAQQLSQLGGGVITQLDVLASELGSLALREWICNIQDMVEQREEPLLPADDGKRCGRESLPHRTPLALSHGMVSRATPSAADQAMSF